MTSLNSLFAPKSVAVVGASRKPGTLGKMFLNALVSMKYKGKIYPVNPKAGQLNGIRCYPDIGAIPDTPDLAVILLPKNMVYPAVEAVAKKQIKYIIIVSAGFKELDAEGKEREEALIALIRKNSMRMIGPNSMGLFNTAPELSLNATFSPTAPIPGHIGFISQSGALGVAVLELSQKRNLGFSCFVSTGNKADIGDVECLRYLAGDKNTKIIILYQESIDNPAEFKKICTALIPHKPVLTLKSGRSGGGLRAISSHTGSLATDDRITDSFIQQCGVIRCDSLQDLLDSAQAFAAQPFPSGNKVAIVTNAGGPGILASDALEKNQLVLAKLSGKTLSALAKILPAEASLNNPVDMIASANHKTYVEVCRIIEKDPAVHSIIVIIVNPPVDTTPGKIISELKSLISHSAKPFLFSMMAGELTDRGLDIFKRTGVPVFSFPETPALVLGKMVKYAEIKKRFKQFPHKTKEFRANTLPITGNRRQATIEEITRMLKNYHLKVCEFIMVKNADQAVDFSRKKGKIVLKIASENIIHKSDKGLVKSNLSSPAEIEDAFRRIKTRATNILPKSVAPLIIAQKMITNGIELVLGAKRDPVFGPVVMFGIGGVFIELYKDVAFGFLPLDEPAIKRMIEELQGKKILYGFRNFPAVNKKLLIKTIGNFSTLIDEHPEIIEIDLNPMIWSFDSNQPIIVDSRCTIISR